MNTQTHVLMGAALFGKPAPRLAWWAAAGGVLPDLAMFAIVATLKSVGYPMSEIFGTLYWQDWWQISNAVGHSFLLWGGLCIGSFIVQARRAGSGFPQAVSPSIGLPPAILALSASALLHSVIDFLCHRDDAHMHFWPLTEWRFRSPVSYWDANYYGNWFGLFEACIGILLAVVLFRRYRSRLLRGALILAIALYAAIPAFFIFNLGG